MRRITQQHALAERTQKRLELVIQSSVAFAEATDEVDLSEILCGTATQAYAAEHSAVFLLQADREFDQITGTNPLSELCSSPDLLDQASKLNEVLLISGLAEAHAVSPRISDAFRRTGVQSMLVAPLQIPGQHLGVLAIFFLHPRTFDEQAAPLADALAGQAARAISGLRLQRQFSHAALHDDTTGLPNRRVFEHTLDILFAAGAPLIAVLFIDLDGFKPVNDRFGHAVGDVILREVAMRLQASVRDNDIVARYGGDEYVVVCAIATETAALDLAERIRSAICAPYPMLPEAVTIGSSIGVSVATADRAITELDQVVRAADQAMYRSKKAGGDQVSVARSVEKKDPIDR